MIQSAVPMNPAVMRLLSSPRRDTASMKPDMSIATRAGRAARGTLTTRVPRGEDTARPCTDDLVDTTEGVAVEKARWCGMVRRGG
ncbi:unnamed protein product [Chondrus crispus]|uniref:Uncharacterized protein n=1 Tax=Chondrus crispus TaxID=2769 RepID=R7Q0E4_CHOCR|nr:unnamed protein product [Chondrus crispus]CDF32122.1 unnamed protein product [Chondrus crispus]|eukprot:XP_005711787.1 unnamed protein product [Chondrus crispus]